MEHSREGPGASCPVIRFDLDGSLTEPKLGITKKGVLCHHPPSSLSMTMRVLQSDSLYRSALAGIVPTLLLDSDRGKQAVSVYWEHDGTTGLFEP